MRLGRVSRASGSGLTLTLLASALVVGTMSTGSPANAAASYLSTTPWAADQGSGEVVTIAGITAIGAGGGGCTGQTGGAGAVVAGTIALASTDTLIAYPGGVGQDCAAPAGGAGGTSADPNGTYSGGLGGNGSAVVGSQFGEGGAGGGAGTTVYKNTSTQVAFAGGGGGFGGDGVYDDGAQHQALGGAGGNGGAAAGTADGGAGSTGAGYNGGTGGNGGTAGLGSSAWSGGKAGNNASCSNDSCGGAGGGGGGSLASLAAQDGSATGPQAAGGGGGQGGGSAAPGLTLPSYSAHSSTAGGSAVVTFIDITAGSVDNATIGGTYSGTTFTADSGWSGLAWGLDASCSGCAVPTGLALASSTGAISGSVGASAGTYEFDVEASGLLNSGALAGKTLKTVTRVSMTVSEPTPTPTPTPTPSPSGDSQDPASNCVTAGGQATWIPRSGTRRLMKSGCVTSAGQWVGVEVNAHTRRGDARYYSLFCQVSNTRTAKTTATGYGDGSRYCTQGALKIRTYGYRLKLFVTWGAPATNTYAAYSSTKAYRT